MPQRAWSDKRERQYEHIKSSQEERGTSEGRAKEIAARTVNKNRAQSGEARQRSKTSTEDISPQRRGGLRSGNRQGPGGRTKAQLYQDARRAGLKGRSKKARLLLAACVKRRATTYLPIDVSREMLAASARELTVDLPDLRVQGLWGRYEAGLARLRDGEPEPMVVAFLGSNLGNTTPEERDDLLVEIAKTLRPGDGFLVSVDLLKPGEVFEACYNDPLDRSAFARFRLNYLTHLNRRFGADFTLEYFYPRAHYDSDTASVQGHLYATEDQSVALRKMDLELDLRRGDSLNVGFSCKFHRPQFVAEVAARGFELGAQWIDAVWQYGMFLFRRSG